LCISGGGLSKNFILSSIDASKVSKSLHCCMSFARKFPIPRVERSFIFWMGSCTKVVFKNWMAIKDSYKLIRLLYPICQGSSKPLRIARNSPLRQFDKPMLPANPAIHWRSEVPIKPPKPDQPFRSCQNYSHLC